MKILMVLTSHGQLGNTGKATGLWLEELAAPYYVFKDAHAEITLASPAGGKPPIDPASEAPDGQTDATRRFLADGEAMQSLDHTHKLADMDPGSFDAVFYAGGHGPLWDLAEDRDSIALIERLYAAGKPVAAVCHGPAVLRRAKAPGGAPLVKGKDVTGFANSEEEAAGLTAVVPFLVEDALKANGGKFSKGADWADHVVADGNLITGQNPASSESTAKALLKRLKAKLGLASAGGQQRR